MASANLPVIQPAGLGQTDRKDAWWAGPLATAITLGVFGLYLTARALMNSNYHVESEALLSPLYSPLIIIPGMPAWLSPAFLILWAPGGFRATCYYYRKAYYRAFFMDPPACAVGEPAHRGQNYKGETSFPFILQNIHRYFMYAALVFNIILLYDAYLAFFPGGHFAVTVGSLVITLNAVLLLSYTLSCHSLRHLVGGKLDCFSCSAPNKVRHTGWKQLTKLNENHMAIAWTSLVGVAATDLYVWLVASGHLTNVHLFG